MSEAQPRQFSTDWFEGHAGQWQSWLGMFAGRRGLRALEIGSFEGRSTVWLLEHILTASDCHIDCVDLFAPSEVYGDYPARFRANTEQWRERITEHAGPSFEMLKQVRGPYDIVYIDGWHSAFGALADGVMSWPPLKVGGVMIFDDYLWIPLKYGSIRRPNKLVRELSNLFGRSWRRAAAEAAIAKVPTETPKLGIDGLLRTLEGHYELLGHDYQLAIRKTSDFGSAVLGIDT